MAITLQGGRTMAGYFKLVDAHDDGFRVKLTAPDGTLVAVSTFYASKEEAIAGIELIREIAGTGPVVDHSRTESLHQDELLLGLQGAGSGDGAVPRDA
ncbi:YegP family protein [Arthrobacter agilis]|uniref:YegP family protein n=2 Tax=Arthrobacter agilis TaxID=37921 RepID=UPI00360B496A